MSNVKKLLSDERRRSNSDGQKITEAQVLFAQMLKDYNSAIENIRQLQQEKRARVILVSIFIFRTYFKTCCTPRKIPTN